jgi:Mn2+/Fe2+ NRAMP family transporter
MNEVTTPPDTALQPLTPALMSRNPLAWLSVFGPGAIIASLTIGTGELIFSTRGGALFGYRILFLFVIISLLKWGLVFATSRHIVLTGVHPYRRMVDLPGPRGWLPISLLMLTAIAMPIWVSFHSGVLGNFASWITDTRGGWNGTVQYAWGASILLGILVLSATGGYSALERIQLTIVTLLVASATITLFLYDPPPDWLEMAKGFIIPQSYTYPDWLYTAKDLSPDVKKIANSTEWVEATRYIGVIGGAGFDYMAYTSFLRSKRWGWAGVDVASPEMLEEMAADPNHLARRWLRAPLVDCIISFVIVIAFSAVFVASGVVVLGPAHEVPTEDRLLDLQAKFVVNIHPWLLPIYVGGAVLTMLGTLYGTIEVAQVILTEITRSVAQRWTPEREARLKRIALLWCGIGGLLVLAYSASYTWQGGSEKPRLLMALMTPANLITGVLSCGIFCALAVWMDRRWLPRPLRMNMPLMGLNLISAVAFTGLALKGFWDNHDPAGHFTKNRWFALGAIAGLFLAGIVTAVLLQRKSKSNRPDDAATSHGE